MKSRRPGCDFAALLVAVSAAWLACGQDGDRADAAGEAARRLQSGADAAAGERPRRNAAGKQSRQQIHQLRRESFAGVDLTEEQQRRLDELDANQQAWHVEHQEALRGLLDELMAARREGDTAAIEDGRTRMRALRQTMPSMRQIIAELSEEQQAQLEKNRQARLSERRAARTQPSAKSAEAQQAAIAERQQMSARRRQQRFAGVEFSEDQQRRLDGLGEARRAWHAEHRDELRALRSEVRAAQKSGDDAAADVARSRIQALRETSPGLDSILAELNDEQRAQIRAARPGLPQPRGAGAASEKPASEPDDPIAN